MKMFYLRQLTALDVASVHSIYFIWNVGNDIFGAYFSDWFRAKHGSRLQLVRGLSIGWGIFSLLPFFDVGLNVRLHYFLSISIFDGFMSFACIARVALMAEFTTNQKSRLAVVERLIKALSFLDTGVTTCAFFIWDAGLPTFRTFALALAFLQVICAEVGYRLCKGSPVFWKGKVDPVPSVEMSKKEKSERQHGPDVCSFISRLVRERNFLSWGISNAIFEALGTVFREYAPIITEIFYPTFSAAILTCFSSTQVFAASALWLADGLGVYVITRRVLSVCLAMGLSALVVVFGFGITDGWVGLLYMFGNKAGMAIMMSFFTVFVTTLGDEFALKHPDQQDVTSLMMASHAAVAKPLNSLGLVMAATMVDSQKFSALQNGESTDREVLERQALWLMILLPLIGNICQTLAFSFFGLHGESLRKIQRLTQKRMEETADASSPEAP